jgi:hypothetical protein
VKKTMIKHVKDEKIDVIEQIIKNYKDKNYTREDLV